MTNEILDGSDVICQFLGEGKRLSDQTRHSLSQRAVESLDVIGFTAMFFDHLILLFWNDTRIRLPAICIESRIVPVALWY